MNSQKPRILILSTSYLPLVGGSELAIKNITDRIPDVEFDMVTGRFGQAPSREKIGNIEVFRVGGRFIQFSLFLPKVFLPCAIFFMAQRLMRQHRYALIHVFQASQAAGAAWPLKKIYPSVPVLLTLQEGKALNAQPWFIRTLRKHIIAVAEQITVISTYLARYARSITHVPVRLIPNGVDVRLFAEQAEQWRTRMRERLCGTSDEQLIISASRLVEKNGLRNLLSAVHEVMYERPNTRLVIIGDGPLRKELEQQAQNLGIASKVLFIGTVAHEEIPRYLGAADVFVRPSLSEGLGTAFLEAMACRVPVVASSVGGISDFISNGDTGVVCDPTNIHSIATGIKSLLGDPAYAKEIAKRAFALVQERYDWDTIAATMKQVYMPFLKKI
ncbi:MAG: glycosyltransferase family 4 protein [Patescibacteria group bacterium]